MDVSDGFDDLNLENDSPRDPRRNLIEDFDHVKDPKASHNQHDEDLFEDEFQDPPKSNRSQKQSSFKEETVHSQYHSVDPKEDSLLNSQGFSKQEDFNEDFEEEEKEEIKPPVQNPPKKRTDFQKV